MFMVAHTLFYIHEGLFIESLLTHSTHSVRAIHTAHLEQTHDEHGPHAIQWSLALRLVSLSCVKSTGHCR